jgi:putative hydrolase of the HAD superfamily
MPYTHIFFDLDDTLYPSTNGLWASIRQRIGEYMLERLGIPAEQVPVLRRLYFENYGTTLRGLQIHHRVDADDFLAYVHDLPIESILVPDAELRHFLLSLSFPKWIFTNAHTNHACRVLSALGVSDCFTDIIDIRSMDFVCKPNPQAYRIALDRVGEDTPERCIYLDDASRNLAPAFNMGFFTVLVGQNGNDPSAKRVVARPHDLRKVMPELWDDTGYAG